ncbi:hypothetical protein ABES03_05615 [Neobacillus rhizosphaerae]|uniref:YncE family protein n=1 Tax=Neobacillus rhizosphaerae TaxID=2880965 RepID=UPI003D26BE13
MKAFIRSLIILVLLFSGVGPFIIGKPVQAEGVSGPISLPFKPNDTAIDPNKPVIYATKLGSKTLYAVNFSTGEIKTLNLPNPAERLDFNNNKLYVTQHKMSHDTYNFGPYTGAIAEVDPDSFTLSNLLDIEQDPYDIAVDNNGYIYIAPGSGQWDDLKVYSMKDKKEVVQTVKYPGTSMYERTNIFYNAETSKVYGITTSLSPRDTEAFEVVNGMIQNHYDSPYHGDYPLDPFASITPDGASMYNNSGVVFDLAMYQSGDMTYSFQLGRKYNDYEFSLQDQLTFAARVDGGIDVYQYNSNKYLYTIKKDLLVQKLHFQNGQLIAVTTSGDGKYSIISIDAKTEGTVDTPPSTPTDPGTPTDPVTPPPASPVGWLEAATLIWNDDIEDFDFHDKFYDGVSNVPLDSLLGVHFDLNVELADESLITIKGPEGYVETYNETSDDTLIVIPDVLKGSTNYTLTIKKEALTGPQGQYLANDIVIKFKTASNWELYDGKWYYYDPAIGDYVTGWKQVSGIWYYFNADGEMQTGWQKIKNVWYYFANSGAMKTGWLKQGTTWYYLDGNGAMKTGWLKQGSTWYYLTGSGAMKTGWVLVGKSWYYFYSSGAMAYNTKIGGYKLGPTGAMIK